MLEDKELIPYSPIMDSSHIWVETLEDLKAMCEKLENNNEIAIDLEVEKFLSINFLLLIVLLTRIFCFVLAPRLSFISRVYLFITNKYKR